MLFRSGGGYLGVILSVSMDVLDKATGHTLINGPKSDESPAEGDLVRVGWFSFVAPAATVVSTHDASTQTFPLSIHIPDSLPLEGTCGASGQAPAIRPTALRRRNRWIFPLK